MSYYDDFTSYLHNPFGYPSEIQRMAIKYFTEKQKNENNFNIIYKLSEIYKLPQHFGNNNSLHQYGLKYHYKKLKQYIIDNRLIGMVLYAADPNNLDETYDISFTNIQTYTTQENINIKLNITTISQYLLKEYCDYYGDYNKGIESEVDKLSTKAVLNQLWIDYKE
tara:strand:- start:57 stop:554 length:498 start_codon:yes stop_codon:yes gene_type:complete